MIKNLINKIEDNLRKQGELKDDAIDFLEELNEDFNMEIEVNGEWKKIVAIKNGFLIDEKGEKIDYKKFTLQELYDTLCMILEYRYRKAIEQFKGGK